MRRLINALVGIVAWCIFALMWWYAFRHIGPARNQIRDVVLVAVLALLVVAVTGSWVAWNVRVWNRTGRRVAIQGNSHDYSFDVTGRSVSADYPSLRTMRYVVIDLEEAGGVVRKRYSAPENQEPTDDEVAACEL